MDTPAPLDLASAVERLAARDASLFADPATAAERLGWIGLPAQAAAEAERLSEFASRASADGITDVVLCGMGGSSLAPLVLSRVVGSAPGYPTLHVLDTTAPAHVAGLLADLLPASTLVIVSSKSGTTIEPLSLAAVFRAWMEDDLGDAAGSHFVAITDPGSPLGQLAADQGFAAVFLAPAEVGGRYAALTPFATVPAALIGIDTARLAGFGQIAEDACHTPGPDNPGAALAAWMSDAYSSGRDKVTLVCSDSLAPFGLWVEQLIAESTGKLGAGLLPVLESAPGLPSAHGGDRMTFVLRTEDDEALAALPESLPDAEPVFEVVVDDPYAIGAEFVMWEWAVALFSAVQDIEPFDQPDVEEAKTTTREILDGRRQPLEPDVLDGATAVTARVGGAPTDLRSAVRGLLEHARLGSYLAVLAYLPEDEELLAPLREACAGVSEALHMAVTFELGPRYLHSTGQYHKGGPDAGLFLVVTAIDDTDVLVPGEPFTLAALHRAQPAGDIATLAGRGRPVVAVELSSADPAGISGLAEAVTSALS